VDLRFEDYHPGHAKVPVRMWRESFEYGVGIMFLEEWKVSGADSR
jgi:hypothetical protein